MQLFRGGRLEVRRGTVGKKTEQPRRQALLEQMWGLARARINDAVKLAYLQEEPLEAIDKLDLAALTEFKRSGNGAVELKFNDRMKALERLLALTEEGGAERLETFLRAMEQGGTREE